MPNIVLAMFKSDGTRRDFPLGKDRVIIGRKVNCDLRIPLTSVSRQHCELTIDGTKITVKDLGSSNGTYHNSQRVQEAHLSAGDELVVGPVVFTVIVDGQPADIKPIRTIVSSEGSSLAPATQEANGGGAAMAAVESEEIDIADLIEDDDSSSMIDLDDSGDAMPTIQMDDDDDDEDDDDDPIAALESLAGDDDSGEFSGIDFFEIDDDEDDK